MKHSPIARQPRRGMYKSHPMLNQILADRRVWTASCIDEPASWYHPLPDVCRKVFHRLRGRPEPITSVELTGSDAAACAEALAPVRAALETGRGFAIVEGP